MVTLISTIALYFILEFNLRPSSIQEKYDAIKDKFTPTDFNADEDFEADKELKQEAPFENLVTSAVEIPSRNFETIKTPNQNQFETAKPVVIPPITIPL